MLLNSFWIAGTLKMWISRLDKKWKSSKDAHTKTLNDETMSQHFVPLRVVFYARVSTEEQRDGQTIDSQIKELERFAQSNQWIPIGVYREEGWSGALLARPELDRLRDDAGKKLFDAVLVNDVDRLARDVTHLNVIRRDLERKGIRVLFRKLPAELSPTQNLMINILGSFAEFEREMILDRTRRGVRYKVEILKSYLGCRPAYGYRYTPKKMSADGAGKLETWPEEATIVRKIYDWVDTENLSARQIVTRLNDSQIPSRKRGGWAKSSVLRVLRNEMYAGVWYYNKHYSCEPEAAQRQIGHWKKPKSSRRLRSRQDWIAVLLPPEQQLVSRDQWERVQKKITANTSWSLRNSKHNYLLRSLVVCAGCGARMVGDPGRNSFSYRCHKRCKKVPEILEERLNCAVWNAIVYAIQDPAIILAQAEKYHRKRAKLQAAAQIKNNEASAVHAQIEREEQRILEAYRLGVIEAEQLQRELETLKARRKAIPVPVTIPEPVNQGDLPERASDRIREYCRRVAQALGTFGHSEKQFLLRILVREIIFDGTRAIIKARIPCNNTRASDTSSPPNDIQGVHSTDHDSSNGIETIQLGDCGRNSADDLQFELLAHIKVAE